VIGCLDPAYTKNDRCSVWHDEGNGKENKKMEYEGVSKSFRTESIMKYMLTTINTRSEATKRFMEAKLTRLTHNIAI
jgi:hypothetical protein